MKNGQGQLVIRTSAELVVKLDRLADMAGLSRSEFVRMILERVQEADIPDGLIQTATIRKSVRLD